MRLSTKMRDILIALFMSKSPLTTAQIIKYVENPREDKNREIRTWLTGNRIKKRTEEQNKRINQLHSTYTRSLKTLTENGLVRKTKEGYALTSDGEKIAFRLIIDIGKQADKINYLFKDTKIVLRSPPDSRFTPSSDDERKIVIKRIKSKVDELITELEKNQATITSLGEYEWFSFILAIGPLHSLIGNIINEKEGWERVKEEELDLPS
ncbi:MAG: hypothetical protein ACE5K4_01435 [Candidatus Hydrothermarchaeota archaeon]